MNLLFLCSLVIYLGIQLVKIIIFWRNKVFEVFKIWHFRFHVLYLLLYINIIIITKFWQKLKALFHLLSNSIHNCLIFKMIFKFFCFLYFCRKSTKVDLLIFFIKFGALLFFKKILSQRT